MRLAPCPIDPTAPNHEPPWNSQMTVTISATVTPMRSQKCQNHARRRPSTSSSRCCWLSRPKRLGHGISRRNSRSTRPRNAITISRVTTSAFQNGQWFWRMKNAISAGLVRTATKVAARVSRRQLDGELTGRVA